MSPESRFPDDVDPNQGSFFAIRQEANAAPDPENYHVESSIAEVRPYGVFPDPADEPVPPERAAPNNDTKTRNRHRGQLGKHSPLAREGEYSHIKVGDFLPGGFGPVTYRNFNEALKHAARLERTRLDTVRPEYRANPTQTVLEVLVGQLSIDSVMEDEHLADSSAPELPQLLGLRRRLEVLMVEADDADFAPATRDEITDALPLLDHGVEGNPHNHLERTRQKVYNDFKNQGHAHVVAEWHAKRAVVSRVYEYGDYLANAAASTTALRRLEEAIAGTNPNLSLDIVVEASQPGVSELVRHIVATLLVKGKMSAAEFDFLPMTSREDRIHATTKSISPIDAKLHAQRRTDEYSDESLNRRNKYLRDPFTDTQQTPEVAAYIAQAIKEITVGDVVRLLPHARTSQQNRQKYWTRMLAGVRGQYRAVAESELRECNRLTT